MAQIDLNEVISGICADLNQTGNKLGSRHECIKDISIRQQDEQERYILKAEMVNGSTTVRITVDKTIETAPP